LAIGHEAVGDASATRNGTTGGTGLVLARCLRATPTTQIRRAENAAQDEGQAARTARDEGQAARTARDEGQAARPARDEGQAARPARDEGRKQSRSTHATIEATRASPRKRSRFVATILDLLNETG
jgi:hypothetical protein